MVQEKKRRVCQKSLILKVCKEAFVSADARKTVVLYTPWTTLNSAALFRWATEKDSSQRSENKSIASLICERPQYTVYAVCTSLDLHSANDIAFVVFNYIVQIGRRRESLECKA